MPRHFSPTAGAVLVCALLGAVEIADANSITAYGTVHLHPQRPVLYEKHNTFIRLADQHSSMEGCYKWSARTEVSNFRRGLL